MTCILFTFLMTTAFWVALASYGLRRVLTNMKNPEAAEAITKHVLTPLFCKADIASPVIDLIVAPSEEELPFAEEEKS